MKQTAQIDEWLRQGQVQLAQTELQALQISKIPREDRLAFANLARRANLVFLSLQILGPIARPKVSSRKISLQAPPTTAELAAYAAGLVRIGAVKEAKALLDSLDSSQCAEVLLYKSYIPILRWDYRQAIPYLKKYIGSPQISEYQKLVGKVNLASAYVAERNLHQVGKLLEELRKSTEAGAHLLLHSNVLELLAQYWILKKDYLQAQEFLLVASKSQQGSGNSNYGFWFKKWNAVLGSLQEGASRADEFLKIRQEALDGQDWETVRECDFFHAIFTKNNQGLTHVIFGTSFKRYREKVKVYRGTYLNLPRQYDWEIGPGGASEMVRILDVGRGRELNGKVELKIGQLLHRALKLLSSDFYRPFRIGEIYGELFPDTFFNPMTSAQQIAQVVQRLRNWFQQNHIPLQIMTLESAYRLQATGPYCLRLTLHHVRVSAHNAELKTLQENWPYQVFSAEQAAQATTIPRRTLSRVLKAAVANKKLFKVGHGRSTLYRFSK